MAKAETLSNILTQLNKTWGSGSVGSATAGLKDLEVIPTGVLSLDHAIIRGGIPKGRLTVIYGYESTGKTTLSLTTIANLQKSGGVAAFIDMEHSVDKEYAQILGVNLDDLIFSQPASAEEAVDIMEKLVKSGEVDLIVLDSVASLLPTAEKDGNVGDAHVGLQARLIGSTIRRLRPALNRTNTALIMLNQIRSKVGIVYGNPDTQPGGNAMRFFPDLVIKLANAGKTKDGAEEVALGVKATIEKSKIAKKGRIAYYTIRYGEGIDSLGDVISLAIDQGLIKKGGAWYEVEGEKFQGTNNLRVHLLTHPELLEEIKTNVINNLKETVDIADLQEEDE